jgi:hypothetical protein
MSFQLSSFTDYGFPAEKVDNLPVCMGMETLGINTISAEFWLGCNILAFCVSLRQGKAVGPILFSGNFSVGLQLNVKRL